MLDTRLAAQLRTHLEKLAHPVELIASIDVTPSSASTTTTARKSTELLELLDELATMSSLITVRRDGTDSRRPSFRIARTGSPIGVDFAGIPLGHEFTSLVLALLQVGGHPPKVTDEVAAQVRALDGEYVFETFFSLSCQNCPDVVQALNAMSVLNPNVRHVAIDGALFQGEVDERQVMAVPSVFLNGQPFAQGRMTLEQIVAKLDTGAAERTATAIDAKDPFDVLVVGGGPAGAAAAVYAARKGIRTGVAADRFGGQVLDTMGIENLISVPKTDGPKLAAALEAHVADYEVDVMNLQTATELVPPSEPGGLYEVRLQSGATLRSRSVVLSTGARWRSMNVPGEEQYRNKGVTYCPHCDGPLFKGKRVAVIGGGNSGVEAAIDLAGLVSHVTLLEFDDRLRADDVLQRKLHSLPNVTVLTSARTTEVIGDGSRLTALVYEDRTTGAVHTIDLEGIFVQIGLLPNTEWLRGTVELSNRGEIVIDDRGQTNLPGVFAAGDCTTVPFKQIVIAMGAGSTAALAAFDHLIRTSAPAAPALATV
ncbi:MAG: alkyl hydroperoxide reductase subunit F [Actinobacteria bacterium]|nr:alkyl hydroperoxide reductase subunit F [Actinomycetota bacterium]